VIPWTNAESNMKAAFGAPPEGSDGRRCDDGTFILLLDWMGVYHRFLD
jgi:hypothetical protein